MCCAISWPSLLSTARSMSWESVLRSLSRTQPPAHRKTVVSLSYSSVFISMLKSSSSWAVS